MWQVLESARETAPEDRFILRHIGELRLYDAEAATSRGRPDRGLSSLETARRLLPGDVRLLGVEADLRTVLGQKERARELLRQLLGRTPDSEYLRRRIAALD
jgi:hypothetical protein